MFVEVSSSSSSRIFQWFSWDPHSLAPLSLRSKRLLLCTGEARIRVPPCQDVTARHGPARPHYAEQPNGTLKHETLPSSPRLVLVPLESQRVAWALVPVGRGSPEHGLSVAGPIGALPGRVAELEMDPIVVVTRAVVQAPLRPAAASAGGRDTPSELGAGHRALVHLAGQNKKKGKPI